MVKATLLFVTIAALSVIAAAQKPESRPASEAKITDVAWMAGCWEMNNAAKGLTIHEQWMAPAGGSMFGMSRTVRNEKTTGFEFMRIVADETSLKLISKPSQNTEETAFRLSVWTSDSVTFSNPDHDFPQRIIYKLSADGDLSAAIEGTNNGKFGRVEFPYKRAKCG